MQVFAETQRLILREILPQDAAAMFELDSDPEVHKYLGNRPIQTLQQADETIKHIRNQYQKNGIGRWAIVEKSSNQFVGWTGLKLENQLVNNHNHYYDLGYRLIKRFWGKGYASESAIASIAYGFKVLQLKTIYAAAHTENIGSNKILQNIGFQFVETFFYDNAQHNWYQLHFKNWEMLNNNGK